MQCTASDSAYTCRQCFANTPGWRSAYRPVPNSRPSHANAADGLEATQITGAYEFMKKAYGPGAAADGPRP